MAKRVLDYNPVTGETVYFDYGQDDRLVITHSQDVEGILENSKALSKEDDYAKAGIKNDMWHYARIPNVIMQDMKEKYHADWNDKNDTNHRYFFKILNTHYRDFKTTTLVHNT